MGKELIPQINELIIYTSAEGDVRVEVLFQNDTFWMNINRIAELFGTTKVGARGIGEDIFTQGRTLDELHENVKEAVACHFGDTSETITIE